MRNMLAFLAAAVLALIGIGYYLDWFKLSVKPDGEGHQRVTIDVNTKKAEVDVSKAVKKGEEFIEKEKTATSKDSDNALNIKGVAAEVGKDIEIKTKDVDLNLPPVKDFQFPQQK
jgi:hypothetical protein